MPTRTLLPIVLLWISGTIFSQAPTNRTVNARAELASKTITIGDQIYLDVYISAPPSTDVYAMDAAAVDGLPGVEVIDAEDLRQMATEPELLFEQRFLITSFDTGYVSIPAQPIFFNGADGVADTAYTNDLLLTVKGAIVSPEDDIMPIKPIIEEPRNWLDYWPLYLILFIVAIGLGVREYLRRKTAEAPPPPPPPPADQRALLALDALEQRQLWQQGQTKEYYSELTRILRSYLEDRFEVPALEMTTRQITTELGRREELDAEGRKELSELLQLSDLVKFAKAEPAEEFHLTGMRRVREFVKHTGNVLQSPPTTEVE